jgi:hypothetical protein
MKQTPWQIQGVSKNELNAINGALFQRCHHSINGLALIVPPHRVGHQALTVSWRSGNQ